MGKIVCPIPPFPNYSSSMRIDEIGNKHGIRLLLNRKPLTKRVATKELLKEGITPQDYIEREMNTLNITHCMVEVTQVNGSSFTSPVTFDYALSSLPTIQLQKSTHEMETNIPLSGPSTGIVYVGHEGFLAKQFEKWYYDEVEKCRKLRNELDQTTRELHTAKNELQLVTLRTELENKQKEVEREQLEWKRDIDWEREKEKDAKGGLNGIMDTLNNSPFLQGIAEKVIDGFINQKTKGLNGLPKIDDPDMQAILTTVVDGLTKMATSDKEHFSYATLVLDNLLANKDNAAYVFKWIEKEGQKQSQQFQQQEQRTQQHPEPPQPPPASPPTKDGNSIIDAL